MILLATLGATAASAQTPPAVTDAPARHGALALDGTGVSALVCEVEAVHADPHDTSAAPTGTAAPPHVVRVADPWGEAVLTGAGAPVPATLFDRGRTLIFDAKREFLYLDLESHRFSYTLFGGEGVTIWRGLCRAEG